MYNILYRYTNTTLICNINLKIRLFFVISHSLLYNTSLDRLVGVL